MHCKGTLSRLSAYLDDELTSHQRREVEGHLEICPACREQLERVRRVGGFLDSLDVPPLPQGFEARVMAEARKRALPAQEKKPFLVPDWWPLGWFSGLSAPMRLVTCALILLACFLGLSMSREISLSGGLQPKAALSESLEGLEWFSPTPPESLGSAYLALAATSLDDGGSSSR